MRIRQRAKQRGVELPLIISDHSDWDELTETIAETGAGEVWVTHGREEALVRWCELQRHRGPAAASGRLRGRGGLMDAVILGLQAAHASGALSPLWGSTGGRIARQARIGVASPPILASWGIPPRPSTSPHRGEVRRRVEQPATCATFAR